MRALGIDVGKKMGWACGRHTGVIKFKSLYTFMSEIEDMVADFNPHIVVSCRPTRFPQVIAAHSKYIAIIELVCEIHGKQFYEGIDSEMKKAALGKGNANKLEIIEWAKAETGNKKISEDEADALMFTHGIKKIACLKN